MKISKKKRKIYTNKANKVMNKLKSVTTQVFFFNFIVDKLKVKGKYYFYFN